MSNPHDPCYCLQAINYEDLLLQAANALRTKQYAPLREDILALIKKYRDARREYSEEDKYA